MPGKMARSDPRPSVRVTRGAGSGQHLASVLQEGRENASIGAGLGFIWRISVLYRPLTLPVRLFCCWALGYVFVESAQLLHAVTERTAWRWTWLWAGHVG